MLGWVARPGLQVPGIGDYRRVIWGVNGQLSVDIQASVVTYFWDVWGAVRI